MVKTTLTIDGMRCSMCETHVNETIRKHFRVSKVSSSHGKGRTEILSEDPLDEAALHSALDPTGYTVTGIRTEPYQKKGFHLFGNR